MPCALLLVILTKKLCLIIVCLFVAALSERGRAGFPDAQDRQAGAAGEEEEGPRQAGQEETGQGSIGIVIVIVIGWGHWGIGSSSMLFWFGLLTFFTIHCVVHYLLPKRDSNVGLIEVSSSVFFLP